MEQTILERLVSFVYVCLERFLGFPKLTALLVTFRLYLLAYFKKKIAIFSYRLALFVI